MSESEPSPKSVLEIHEELLQRVEDADSKIKALAVLTVLVSALLLISYLSQIALPYASGVTTVTVNLLDPSLVALQIGLIVFTAAWLYVGLSNYRFVHRMAESIKAARAREKELESSITGQPRGG
jgi:hypothetical protein